MSFIHKKNDLLFMNFSAWREILVHLTLGSGITVVLEEISLPHSVRLRYSCV